MTTKTPRLFKVGVFFDEDSFGRRTKFRAYTVWYNPIWGGCVEVEVPAVNGTEAKKMAIEQVKAMRKAST